MCGVWPLVLLLISLLSSASSSWLQWLNVSRLHRHILHQPATTVKFYRSRGGSAKTAERCRRRRSDHCTGAVLWHRHDGRRTPPLRVLPSAAADRSGPHRRSRAAAGSRCVPRPGHRAGPTGALILAACQSAEPSSDSLLCSLSWELLLRPSERCTAALAPRSTTVSLRGFDKSRPT